MIKQYIVCIALILLAVVGFANAHEGVMDYLQGIDIHLTPEQAFQNNPVAIEAYIEENNTALAGLSVFFVVDKHDIGLSERIEAKEREPGRYVIKYEFKNSGTHEIHVEFTYNEDTIRKTFDIEVAGNDNVFVYFIGLALIFLIASVGYYFRSRRWKASACIAIILLLVTGLGYSVYDVYATGAAERGVVVCTSGDDGGMTPGASGHTCYWSAHIHTEVNIDLCGDTSYRFPVEKGRLDGPHTHEERNLIHFHERLKIDPTTREILGTQPLTLGAFFDAMEVSFDSDKIIDSANGETCNGNPASAVTPKGVGSVKMFVSENWNRNSLGKPIASFRDYIWKDGGLITIIIDELP